MVESKVELALKTVQTCSSMQEAPLLVPNDDNHSIAESQGTLMNLNDYYHLKNYCILVTNSFWIFFKQDHNIGVHWRMYCNLITFITCEYNIMRVSFVYSLSID